MFTLDVDMKKEFIIYIIVFLLGAVISWVGVFFMFWKHVEPLSQDTKTQVQMQENTTNTWNTVVASWAIVETTNTWAIILTWSWVEISTPVNIDEPFCKIKKDVSSMSEEEYSQYASSLWKLNKKYSPKNVLSILRDYESCDTLQKEWYLTDENIGDCYIDIAVRELATNKKLSSERARKLLEENVPTFKELEAAFVENKCGFVMKVNRELLPLCKWTKSATEYYKEWLEEARKLICE